MLTIITPENSRKIMESYDHESYGLSNNRRIEIGWILIAIKKL